MKLQVITNGIPDSGTLLISESMYWYLRGALEKFSEETGIDVDIESDANVEIEGGGLVKLFLTLEPIANGVRGSSDEYIQEVGLVEARDQIMMYQTRREEGLAMIERLMERANAAYNDGSTLRIRSIPETK